MIPHRIKVSDNITLNAIRTDKFKTAAITFSLTVPLTARGYLCGMLLGGVLRRGCAAYPSMALINRRLDELYAASAELQCVSGRDTLTLCLGAELLDNRFALDGTDILGDVIDTSARILTEPLMKDGVFPADTVRSEIGIAADYLAAEKNNTRAYAATRCRELMNRMDAEQPTLEYLMSNIDTVTPRELTEHYSHMLTSPLNVFYIGAASPETVAERLKESFGGRVGGSAAVRDTKGAWVGRGYISLTEDMPVSQGKLVMGMSTGVSIINGGYHAAILLNELLGASPASKLFLNVRERLSLCYYCSSAYSLSTGDITVSSGLDPKNLELAKSEILRQLDEIRKGNISDAEWTAARRSIEFTYSQIYDSPYALQAFYTARDTVGSNETVEQCKERILAVSTEEVSELARQISYDTCFFINGTLTADDGMEGDTYDDE